MYMAPRSGWLSFYTEATLYATESYKLRKYSRVFINCMLISALGTSITNGPAVLLRGRFFCGLLTNGM